MTGKLLEAEVIDREKDDNPEWTEADFARAKPASEVHGPEAAAALVRFPTSPDSSNPAE